MKQEAPRFLEVDLEEGWTARIGKSSRDNDLLTFRESFPQDWWLHAKGCPGSHVVMHHPSRDEPPRQILETAARLALKYSKASPKGKGSVTVARISDLGKAKGAPPGQVIVRKSRIVKVYCVG